MTKSFGINLEKITKPIISDGYVTTPSNSSSVNSIFGENTSTMPNIDSVDTANKTETKTTGNKKFKKSDYRDARNELNKEINTFLASYKYVDSTDSAKKISAEQQVIEDLIEHLKNSYNEKHVLYPIYQEYITILENVHNEIFKNDSTYTKKEDVNKAIKTAKNSIKESNSNKYVKEWARHLFTGSDYSGFFNTTGKELENFNQVSKLYKNILTQKVITNNYKTLMEEYNKSKKTDDLTSELNYGQEFDKIKDFYKQQVANNKMTEFDYENEVFDLLKKELTSVAKNDFYKKLGASKGEKSKEIKKEISENDKILKDIVKDSKDELKLKAISNKIEKRIKEVKTNASYDELKQDLGEDLAKKITLKNNEFINADGSVNMQTLGKILIEEFAGMDNTINYSKDKESSEIQMIINGLNAKGIELDSKDVKKLCKYFEIPVESKWDGSAKNWLKAVGILTVAGLNAAFPFRFNYSMSEKIPGGDPIHRHKEFNLRELLAQSGCSEDQINAADELFDFTLIRDFEYIPGDISVKIDYAVENHFVNPTILTPIALYAAVKSFERAEEKDAINEKILRDLATPCGIKTTEYIENVLAHLDTKAPAVRSFVKNLAAACSYYDEKENVYKLDTNSLNKVIKDISGTGSAMNEKEVKSFMLKLQAGDYTITPKPCDCEETDQPAKENKKIEKTEENEETNNITKGNVIVTETSCTTPYQGKNYSYTCWDNLLDAYGNCLLEKCGNNRALAIRVLKIAQGVKDTAKFNNIDELIKLAKKSYTRAGRQEMKNDKELKEWFDYDKFYRYFSTSDMTDIILPKIDDCQAGEVKKGAKFKSSGSTNLKGTNPTIMRKSTGFEATATYKSESSTARGNSMDEAVKNAKAGIKDKDANFEKPVVIEGVKEIDC